MLSEFAKVFERKVVQVAHLHNAARALSSLSRRFQLSTNLDKDFFQYLWHCRKEQIECRLACHWWNSTDLGLIDTFFLPIRIQRLLLIITPQAESGKCFQIWFFPRFGGENLWKMAAFWACACKLSWTLFSPARVQPLYGAGRKESSGTGIIWAVINSSFDLFNFCARLEKQSGIVFWTCRLPYCRWFKNCNSDQGGQRSPEIFYLRSQHVAGSRMRIPSVVLSLDYKITIK